MPAYTSHFGGEIKLTNSIYERILTRNITTGNNSNDFVGKNLKIYEFNNNFIMYQFHILHI